MEQQAAGNVTNMKSKTTPVIDGTSKSVNDRNESQKQADFNELSNQKKIKASNQKKLTSICKKAVEDLLAYEKDRSSVNADMQAIREDLQSKGIPKKALAAAINVSKMTEKEMDGFDAAYRILRDAIDKPIQSDLFPKKEK